MISTAPSRNEHASLEIVAANAKWVVVQDGIPFLTGFTGGDVVGAFSGVGDFNWLVLIDLGGLACGRGRRQVNQEDEGSCERGDQTTNNNVLHKPPPVRTRVTGRSANGRTFPS
jgi:hypothetical protein